MRPIILADVIPSAAVFQAERGIWRVSPRQFTNKAATVLEGLHENRRGAETKSVPLIRIELESKEA
jgi:hypothetical protein